MDGYDFIAQYLLVILGVLCASYRGCAPMLGNMNIERLIHERRFGAVSAAKARATLVMMRKERVS